MFLLAHFSITMATENLTGKNVRLGNKSALNRASFYSEENKLSCRKINRLLLAQADGLKN